MEEDPENYRDGNAHQDLDQCVVVQVKGCHLRLPYNEAQHVRLDWLR